MKVNSLNYLISGIVFFITFLDYFATMAPTVSYWDCGEFIATSYILGVPHPPGSPLFLIIGRIFSLFPIRKEISKLKQAILNNSPTKESVKLLSEICKEKCKPYIAYIPMGKLEGGVRKSNKFRLELINLSKKNNITFIDGKEIIDSENRKNYAPNGGHLSIDGYKKFSEHIIKVINKKS